MIPLRRRTNRVADSGEFAIVSSDDHEFHHIPNAVKAMSSVINAALDRNTTGVIRLDKYDQRALQPVVDFLKGHGRARGDVREERIFNEGFLFDFPAPDLRELFDALLVSGDLDIPVMVDVVSRRIADRIKDQPLEWVKATFGIKNDLPADEVMKVQNEYPWAFQDIEHD